jgi:hypothetical protein
VKPAAGHRPLAYSSPEAVQTTGTVADHHVSQEHLKRYLCEFDFRYNYRVALGFTDMQRTELAAAGIYGKRLTYRRTGQQPNA